MADGEEAVRRGDTTSKAFLAALDQALAPLSEPMGIQATAARLLGQHLGASRALYSDVEAEGERYYYFVTQDYHAPGETSLVGRFLADDFGMALFYELRAGRVAVVPDVSTAPMLGEDERASYRGAGLQAFIGVPHLRDGHPVAFMSVQQVVPRAWTAEEVALVEEAAGRTWVAIKRARASMRA